MGSIAEQIVDGHRQIVIRRHQAAAGGDDAVAVVVGIAGEGHVELVLQADEPLHGIRGGGVHADLPIPIESHETEGGIYRVIDHREIEPVGFRDARPVVHSGAAQRVHAHADSRVAYRVHIQDGAEVAHIGLQVVVSMGGGAAPRRGKPHSVDPTGSQPQQLVGSGLDPLRHIRVRGAAVGRVVFEAAVIGRIVRGRDDDTVGETGFAAAVIGQDGM